MGPAHAMRHAHGFVADPVDAALEHHAADDVPVVELVIVEGPAPLASVAHDPGADNLDSGDERRVVIAERDLYSASTMAEMTRSVR